MPIDPSITPGAVRLTVREVDRVRAFYEEAIGLRAIETGNDLVRLGAGDTAVVELLPRPDAHPRPPATTGLFHLAILFPDRAELARALRRATEAGARIGGASDHLVSEALYLSDPEGNGIELYRDRPRSDWPRAGGEIQMSTLPLDVPGLLAEIAPGDIPAEAPDATRIGHVHLQVGDLGPARKFYEATLGFDVTVESYPGALFLSAGGYHHHIGLNTWAGEGAPPPGPGAAGLRWFEILLPSPDQVAEIAACLREAGDEAAAEEGGVLTADPSANGILLRSAPG